MSVLGPGEEWMHHCDGSHRWLSPYGEHDQAVWEERIRAHQAEHRRQLIPRRKPATIDVRRNVAHGVRHRPGGGP